MVSLTNIKNNFANAGATAVAGVGKGVKGVGKLLGNQDTQNKIDRSIAATANNFRKEVALKADNTIRFMNEDGVKVLRAPIKGMKDLEITRLEIKREDHPTTASLKKAVNGMATYHEKVVKAGERISRIAGDQAHALTRVPFMPITGALRFVGLTQLAKAVELVQNAVALAVGFVVRAALLAVSQLAHLVPYAAVAGALAGAGIGIAAATAAYGAANVALVVLSLATLANTIAVSRLSSELHAQKVEQMRKEEAAEEANRNSGFVAALRRGLSKVKNNPGKAATTAALIGGAYAAYQVGTPAMEAALRTAFSRAMSFFSTPAVAAPVAATAEQVAKTFEAATSRVVPANVIASLSELMREGSKGIASQEAAALLRNGSRVAIGA